MHDEYDSRSIEHERFEVEKYLKQQELELKKQELELKKSEVRLGKWRNPIFAAVLVALLGILGSFYTNYQQLKNGIAIEREKLRSDLILEAIKAGSTEKAKDNLKAFIDMGLLKDESGEFVKLLEEESFAPVLPVTVPVSLPERTIRLEVVVNAVSSIRVVEGCVRLVGSVASTRDISPAFCEDMPLLPAIYADHVVGVLYEGCFEVELYKDAEYAGSFERIKTC